MKKENRKIHFSRLDIIGPGLFGSLAIFVALAVGITLAAPKAQKGDSPQPVSASNQAGSSRPPASDQSALPLEWPAGAHTRPFRMGFTPWPYDLTLEAVQWVDRTIKEHGDIIEQHFEEGVPWPEALAGTSYKPAMEKEMQSRVQRMVGYKRVVSINALNMGRDGLALYRGDAANQALPGEWQGKRLNDPKVIKAYTQYVERVIDTMKPDYLLVGVEVNLLQRRKDSTWEDYLVLHKAVYEEVKARHPQLPVMASVIAPSYFKGLCSEDDSDKQKQELKKLLPYLDIVGFSVHPFMSSLACEKVPDRKFFKELFALAEGKPFAITETSYPAQKWDMWFGFIRLPFNGSEEKQANYLKALFEQSLADKPVFISWFTVRDYDQLYEKLKSVPTLIVWRDTGLFDENGKARPALKLWDAVLKAPLK